MSEEEFAQCLNKLLSVQGPFAVQPYVNNGSVLCYFEDTPSYADCVNREVRIFRATDDNRIVGCELKCSPRWNTEKPTKPGWYYAKDNCGSEVVYARGDGWLLRTGHDFKRSVDMFTHFAGPIPEPES